MKLIKAEATASVVVAWILTIYSECFSMVEEEVWEEDIAMPVIIMVVAGEDITFSFIFNECIVWNRDIIN